MELNVSKTVSCIKKFVHEQKNNREKNKPYYLKEDCMKLLETILEVNKFEFAKKIIEVYPEFLSDPASRQYHGNYQGGLFEHSIGVYAAALEVSRVTDLGVKSENVDAIACIFHDLCKVGLYKKYTKKDGSISYDYVKDFESIQHGPESLKRLLNIIIDNNLPYRISDAWQQAIAFHMASFDVGQDERMKYTQACRNHPEVLLLHTADMIESTIYNK